MWTRINVLGPYVSVIVPSAFMYLRKKLTSGRFRTIRNRFLCKSSYEHVYSHVFVTFFFFFMMFLKMLWDLNIEQEIRPTDEAVILFTYFIIKVFSFRVFIENVVLNGVPIFLWNWHLLSQENLVENLVLRKS